MTTPEKTPAQVVALSAQMREEEMWCAKFCGDSRHLTGCRVSTVPDYPKETL